MTVTYTAEVATSTFSCFLKLLLRWKGSVYKLLWKDFLIFAGLYYTLSFVYRFALNDDQKRIFERVANYCETYNSLIPVAFVLGFYVTIVVDRWWEQFKTIPWPDRMALFTTANLHGHDDRGRLMRRTLMRYLCLSFVITMASISPAAKRRFPTWTQMTEAGFMLEGEQKVMEAIPTNYNKYFVPLSWATSLVARARKEGRIKDDFAVKTLIDEINDFRGCLGGLFNFDYVSVPLVYTQVVTLAVYTFFLSCLMGRQFLERGHTGDVYVPVFTFLQFFFYMGWLKVAETLVNPFGEDDDDFEINMLVDRNLQVSYLYVDEMHGDPPELIKDQYWDEIDCCPPYPDHVRNFEPFLGSAMNINIPQSQREIRLESVREYDDTGSPTSAHSKQGAAGSFLAHFKPGRRGSKRSLVRDGRVDFKRRQLNSQLSQNSTGSRFSQLSSETPLTADTEGLSMIFPMDDTGEDVGVDEVDERGEKIPAVPGKSQTNASPRAPLSRDTYGVGRPGSSPAASPPEGSWGQPPGRENRHIQPNMGKNSPQTASKYGIGSDIGDTLGAPGRPWVSSVDSWT